ncbi:IclR family transcriptional regulator [Natronobeatus ordinarius]|uniref:IclR family transcriptional regulator n=1 Tax=Natronobeatus ordinarius TaxID=2963433 RepID=UPI0020CBEEB2|nr:IclR family transcriptional regulator [Natronobeatus ordinarius]
MKDTPARPVTTVETTIKILEEIKERDEATLDELSSAVGIAKSTTHRHLQTLEQQDFVTRSEERYRIGLRMLGFGIHARAQRELFHVTRPKIDELAEETGERVWCITHEHGRSIHLYGAAGSQSVKTQANEGDREYLHHTAAGKAILSTFDRDRIEAIIEAHGLPARTEDTITSKEDLLEELDWISKHNYAFNRGESVPRLHAVGAPITDSDGVAIGAISISGPSNRLKGDVMTEKIPDLLLGSTNEVEINMNYS